MQICRYHDPEHGVRLGLIHEGRVLDVTAIAHSITDLLSQPEPAKLLAPVAETATQDEGLVLADLDRAPAENAAHLLAPLDHQEVWAAGVTYLRSRDARMEESEDGGSFYDKVYDAARPELFLKATPHRTVGPNAPIVIRRDSTWNVPEPEVTLVLSPRKQLVGYTVGNDVSSRSIEGENPLYLPQAKTYVGSAAIGPVITLADSITDPTNLGIALRILRDGETVFTGETSTARMKRSFADLVSYLGREQTFPHGVMLMTGTGIVPPDNFTLKPGDVVEIEIDQIGTLRNPVVLGAG